MLVSGSGGQRVSVVKSVYFSLSASFVAHDFRAEGHRKFKCDTWCWWHAWLSACFDVGVTKLRPQFAIGLMVLHRFLPQWNATNSRHEKLACHTRDQCTIIANRHLIKFLHHGTLKSLRFNLSDVSVKVLRRMGIHEIIIIFLYIKRGKVSVRP